VSDSRDRASIERMIDQMLANPHSRRTLLRRGAGGALGISLAGFLAACGDDDGGGGGSKQVEKGAVANSLFFSNWPDYMDEDHAPLKTFQKKYGTKVKYVEDVNDNDQFFGKMRPLLESGKAGGRDLWVLTDWMAARMIQLDYVQKLDPSGIPNVKANLIDSLKSPAFDPNRDYSVPWQSGMTGLIYRKDKVDRPSSINAIFDPKYKGKVTMLTEMRDTVGLTMLGMGMDPAKATLDQANQALDKIDKANSDGQIRRFTGNDYIRDLPKGDSWLVYGWSGDGVQLKADNPNIDFVFPDEGVMLWADNMQIPIGAPHAWTAEVFMNHVYDPEVQAPLAEYINYVTPVKGVKEVLEKKDPKLAENQLIFPNAETLSRTHIFNRVSPDDEAEMNERFQQIIGA
jgi:spermidine/putrescine transport system substrate-binding protein